MIPLNQNQIVKMHDKIVAATGGLQGIRDETALNSALFAAFQTFGGVELYPTIVEKIVRTTYGVICNHAFADGNKRTGTYVMLELFDLNNIKTNFSDDDIVRIGVETANGTMKYEQLLEFIQTRIGE